ncbi:unnamed protein product [Closterium sp. Naga37s-1]|nr:unnamed protein product [Closterium sp. Naga37s-1]
MPMIGLKHGGVGSQIGLDELGASGVGSEWQWAASGGGRRVAVGGEWRWAASGGGRRVAVGGEWRWTASGGGRRVAGGSAAAMESDACVEKFLVYENQAVRAARPLRQGLLRCMRLEAELCMGWCARHGVRGMCFYIVLGRGNNKDKKRILKINRSEPLVLVEDPTVYTAWPCSALLQQLAEGNRSSGGLRLVTKAYGIVVEWVKSRVRGMGMLMGEPLPGHQGLWHRRVCALPRAQVPDSGVAVAAGGVQEGACGVPHRGESRSHRASLQHAHERGFQHHGAAVSSGGER